MTPLNLIRHRLYNQQLSMLQFTKPDEVVGWMGAIQAQDYLGALWAIGLRLPTPLKKNIEQTIANKTIVRSWLMRGTLHFVAASDIGWMLGLVSERIIAGNARRYGELGLDEQTFEHSNAVLAKALQGGKQRNRTDLLGVLRGRGISTDGQRAAYLLQRAALDGLICQGVTQRNVPMYFALEPLPKTQPMTKEEALAELARRYFQSRGPATLPDFMWWSGLTKADAKAGLDQIEAELKTRQLDGKTYWLMQDTANNPPPTTHLLPAFDEYLVAYKDRDAALNPLHVQHVNAGGGMLSPTIVHAGQVIATWKRTLKKDTVIIELNRFAPFSKAQNRAISDAVERYSSFLGVSTVVVI